MKYHCIAIASDETVGTFPQVHQFDDGYNPQDSGSIDALNKSLYKPVIGKVDIRFKLDRSAKETDFMSCVPLSFGLLVSKNLLDLLKQFALPAYQSFEVTLNVRGERKTCYWIHFTEDVNSLVDFSQTIFTEYNPWTKESKKLQFQNAEERKAHTKTLKSLTTVTSNDLYLKPHSFDLLSLRYLWHGFAAVSPRLFSALKEANITGFVLLDHVQITCP